MVSKKLAKKYLSVAKENRNAGHDKLKPVLKKLENKIRYETMK